MKASTAIEVCLLSGIYQASPQGFEMDMSFMCNALEAAKQQGLISPEGHTLACAEIQTLLSSLSDRAFGTLSNALRDHASKLGDPESLAWVWTSSVERTPHMRQLYCWFVFDLRRRGL